MVGDGRLQAQHNYSSVPLDTNIAGTGDIGFAVPDDAVEPLMRMCYGITAHTPNCVQALRASDVIGALESGQRLASEGRRLILGSDEQLNQVQKLIAASSEDGEVFVSHDIPATATTGSSYAVTLPEELHDAATRLVEALDFPNLPNRYLTFRASAMVPGDSDDAAWTGTGEHPLIVIGTHTDVSAALEFVEQCGFRIESLSSSPEEADTLDKLTVPS